MSERKYSERKWFNGLPVWSVSLRNVETNELIKIDVPAVTNEEATGKLSDLLGHDGMYRWEGTGPTYSNVE